MNTTTQQRQAMIDGLRDLAQFLTDNPEIPFEAPEITHHVLLDDDTDGIARVAELARILNVEVTDVAGRTPQPENTHYYARKQFGPVRYEVAYVRTQAMADWSALMSYEGTIRAEERAA